MVQAAFNQYAKEQEIASAETGHTGHFSFQTMLENNSLRAAWRRLRVVAQRSFCDRLVADPQLPPAVEAFVVTSESAGALFDARVSMLELLVSSSVSQGNSLSLGALYELEKKCCLATVTRAIVELLESDNQINGIMRFRDVSEYDNDEKDAENRSVFPGSPQEVHDGGVRSLIEVQAELKLAKTEQKALLDEWSPLRADVFRSPPAGYSRPAAARPLESQDPQPLSDIKRQHAELKTRLGALVKQVNLQKLRWQDAGTEAKRLGEALRASEEDYKRTCGRVDAALVEALTKRVEQGGACTRRRSHSGLSRSQRP